MVVRGPKPATYPDIHMYRGDVPFSWKVTLKDDGVPVDITDSEISAPVFDDGKQVGSLTVEKTDPVNGQVKLTFTEALHAAVGRYSTWRFREETIFNFLLLQGRLVKEV
jgi:hypothetical protein